MSASNQGSAVFLVLRRMRAPLIVLILMYSVSVLGLMLVPGVDENGDRTPGLDFFHAFYVISYTASTIGFGELPKPFSDAQRMWVTLSIYLTVVGWSYSVVTLLALVQDKALASTFRANRFGRRVRFQTEPFYLLCGGGSTGLVIAQQLVARNRQVVIVDIDEIRIQEIDLEDLASDPPLFAGDAREVDTLLRAGLSHPQCRGVLAVTNDDHANLSIAIAAKLLNPEYPVLARVTDPVVADNLASFNTDHILNPFEEFARELALAISAPQQFRLSEVVTGLPASRFPSRPNIPQGAWIVVGYGRFGQSIIAELHKLGLELCVIDNKPIEEMAALPSGVRLVHGHGTDADVLRRSGAATSAGIVAATNDDADNLSIAMTARALNEELYLVMRQNSVANQPLFDAFPHEAEMVSTRIIAEEAVVLVTAPMVVRFDQLLSTCGEMWCSDMATTLRVIGRDRVPSMWEIWVDDPDAANAALHRAVHDGQRVLLRDLLRDHRARDDSLNALPLMLERATGPKLRPDLSTQLMPGDRILFAGTRSAWRRMQLTLSNPNLMQYVLTGREEGGWLFTKLIRPRVIAQEQDTDNDSGERSTEQSRRG